MNKITRNGKTFYMSDYSQKVNKKIRYAMKRELAHQIRNEIAQSPQYIARQYFEEKMESGMEMMKRIERIES